MTSAEIFLSTQIKNVKKLLHKIILFAVLQGVYDAITIQYWNATDLNQLRLIINLTFMFLLIKIIFRKSWWDTLKVIIFYIFFGTLSQTTLIFLVVKIYKLPIDQTLNNPQILFEVFVPLEFLSLIIALLLRKFRTPLVDFFTDINVMRKFSSIRSVALAILLQLVFLISLMADYLDNLTFHENTLRFLLIIIINIGIILLSIFILIKTIRKTEEKMVEASSSAISESLHSLIYSVRSQRHDFINHIQIINSLLHTQDEEGLAAYLNQLTNDITVLNNVLKVDNPFIGALLNSKITKAGLKEIDLQVDITAKLANLSAKAFDLTRILDNLINNAIEEIEQNNNDEKWIKVIIKEQGPFLSVAVTNPGSPPAEVAEKLFEPGYTTKDGEHSGLGLHICKQLSKKLHGKLEVKTVPGIETCFLLIIPKF